ncbi:MAG: 23S rRNA (adenine(2503)-C(2))-methyltransferase RlmN [Thermoanaerobaculum sp.]|nr:23S rRNA (adenine(2503)-C(2))-methyltransferase RlmN [Thermoanaerobaculum sp.]MDW7968127.1 23S rRNA (adenine(2503)-C(2))-methyltransferase RlmN [Thermoanaerobaculum sp.]
MTESFSRRNLMGLPLAELSEYFAGLGEPPFRARQVYHWICRRLAGSFQEMSDLPQRLRQRLEEEAFLADPEIVERRQAADGTVKYALRMLDGTVVEAVVMPMDGHHTLCLSAQAGCAVGCRFCVTGALGAGRNLRAFEIFGQFRQLMRDQKLLGQRVNVVFMGMGEPLFNFDQVVASLALLGETVSLRRITVSTAGVVPKLDALGQLPRRPNLAVSLNATTDEQRARLMPGVARWPLPALLEALRRYPLERGRRITIEYVLIAEINDSLMDAKRLVRLLTPLRVKVNLIPLNPDPVYLPGLAPPSEERISAFAGVLAAAGVNVSVRRSKGLEVAAACGQLRGQLAGRARNGGLAFLPRL